MQWKVRNRTALIAVSLALIIMMSLPAFASATTWSKTSGFSNSNYTFTVYQYIPGVGYVPIPVVAKGSGTFQEDWNGTQGGTATLNVLWLSGMVTNYSQISEALEIASITPYCIYANNFTFDIDTPRSWVLHSPGWIWQEGTCGPALSLNNPSVKGYVELYSPNSLQLTITKYISWTQ
ncbi:MAG: hypothetical protein ABFD04_02505 [Syntrophomonas sp.]